MGAIWSSIDTSLTCHAHDGEGEPTVPGVLDVACQPGWAPVVRLIASPRECVLTPDEADALAAALVQAAAMLRAEPIEGHL
ncbi:MAG: hypothetical protein ABIS47_10575 [Acidimicrobiales bacterium]